MMKMLVAAADGYKVVNRRFVISLLIGFASLVYLVCVLIQWRGQQQQILFTSLQATLQILRLPRGMGLLLPLSIDTNITCTSSVSSSFVSDEGQHHHNKHYCTTDLDCSLNGICNQCHGTCHCDKPWIGNHCELLDFKPVKFPQGYGMIPNITTWGGGIIHHEEDDGGATSSVHHLFVSRMTNYCPLSNWMTNSRIDHAISTTGPDGPYVFHDVAIPTWSHNPTPIKLSDGRFALFHIGDGDGSPDGGMNCTNSSTPTITIDDDITSKTFDTAKMIQEDRLMFKTGGIHISNSVNGPWNRLVTNLDDSCNNPAPWIHPNGTIYVGCYGGTIKRANQIEGPYEDISKFPMSGGPIGEYEDPQLYTDKNGNFHILHHVYTTNLPSTDCTNSTVSAHAYSKDGYEWHISKVQPYGTQLEIITNDNDGHDDNNHNNAKSHASTTKFITLATRERPKPYINSEGIFSHLIQGVCGSPYCEQNPKHHNGCVSCKNDQWDYTLVVPLNI